MKKCRICDWPITFIPGHGYLHDDFVGPFTHRAVTDEQVDENEYLSELFPPLDADEENEGEYGIDETGGT